MKTILKILLQIIILIVVFYAISYLNVVFASNFVINLICSGLMAFLFFQIPFLNKQWMKLTLALMFILAVYFEADSNIYWFKNINIIAGIYIADISKKYWPKIALIGLIIFVDFVCFPYTYTEWLSNTKVRDAQIIFSDCYLLDRNKDSMQLEKGKVYLLNFSFVGCLPCRNKHPQIEKLQQDYKNHPQIRVLSIHTEDDFDIFKKFAKDQYHDAGLKFMKKLKIWGLPMEYFIDKKGRIRKSSVSYDKSLSWVYQMKTRELLEKLSRE